MAGNMGKVVGAVVGLGGLGAVFMQFSKSDPIAEAAMPEDVKKSPLKRTLSKGGLYPQPEAAKPVRLLKTQSTGSMAAFTQGEAPLGDKGSGSPM